MRRRIPSGISIGPNVDPNQQGQKKELTIDEHFEIVKALLGRQPASSNPSTASDLEEKKVFKEEKRYLRYERIIRPMALSSRFDASTLQKLKVIKHKFFPNRKEHYCSAEECSFVNLPKGFMIDGRVKATGMVYVCITTLAVHICGESRCNRSTRQSRGTLVCDITGVVLGVHLSSVQGRWVRPGVENEDRNGIEPDAGDDDQRSSLWDEDEEVMGNELESDIQDYHDSLARKPSSSSSKGKRKSSTSENSKNNAKRQKTAESYESNGNNNNNSISGLEAKFSHGSVAHRMLQRSEGGKAGDIPSYGRKLVRFSMESITPNNNTCAAQICHSMLYDVKTKALFDESQKAAARTSEKVTDLYFERCSREGRTPDRWTVYSLYWTHLRPFFAPSLSRVLAYLADCDHTAKNYFARAILNVWKIIEATPYCCESILRYGGAAAKKKKAHTHVKKMGPAILYHLKKGLRYTIFYNRATRLVYMDEKEAKETGGMDIAKEVIEFLPAHNYLWSRLPKENEVKFLDFSGVMGNGVVDRSTISNMSTIMSCYRSLLCVKPVLTIDQIREFKLCEHLKIMDESPVDGTFGPVDEAEEEDEEDDDDEEEKTSGIGP